MILGAIADDFTGASDLANTLARGGMRTTLYAGVPAEPADASVEAGVVALKSRTIPAAEAVASSRAALDWLQAQGCRQVVFKYCSTFDSTDAGNIGPVAEALAAALGETRAIVCPAFPATGRTVYQGHLFVGDRLLSESGMQRHPLTPMTDPDLRRVLARQASGPVGHVPHRVVAAGPAAIAAALSRTEAPLIVVDALTDDDLRAIGRAARDRRLLTGGSGIALGLPANFADAGLLAGGVDAWAGVDGPAVALAGSASTASRAQVARHRAAGHPARAITTAAAIDGAISATDLAEWALRASGVPLIHTEADPERLSADQARFGREAAAAALEGLLAATARVLADRGAARLIVAGGETSGAIVAALGVRAMAIGPEIDPGVPALMVEGRPLALALKSGNFGAEDFFEKAAARLAAPA